MQSAQLQLLSSCKEIRKWVKNKEHSFMHFQYVKAFTICRKNCHHGCRVCFLMSLKLSLTMWLTLAYGMLADEIQSSISKYSCSKDLSLLCFCSHQKAETPGGELSQVNHSKKRCYTNQPAHLWVANVFFAIFWSVYIQKKLRQWETNK